MALRRSVFLVVGISLVGLIGGCTGSASVKPSEAALASASTGGPVAVELKEWSVVPAATTAKAGAVSFRVTNAGTVVHEFVVVRTDSKAGDLKIVNDKVDESALTPVDEIEDIAPGTDGTLDVTLAAGHYVLLCNIEGHAGKGMRTDFDVN